MSSRKPNITDYDDYRKFIADSLVHRKSQKLESSYRWIANESGFKSPNIIHLVVKGERHLTAKSGLKVAKALELNKTETDFFIKLLGFTKSSTYTERDLFAAEMIRSKKISKINPLRKDQFEYYANWYNIIVREYLTLARSNHEIAEIAKSIVPPLKDFEVSEALNILERLGMIKKDSTNKYAVTENTIGFGNKVTTTGLVRFHRKMMDLASESLDRFPSAERSITGLTAGLSEENFIRAKEMIQDLRETILAMSEQDLNKDKLFQFNFQLFPISKKGKL